MKAIPKSAKKVFAGEIFDVYQWRQKMFDNSFQIFEAIKRPDTVEIIGITPGKKIIVLKQKQPHTDWFFSLPGGRVDQGENQRQAAQRELKEETGYETYKLILWKSIYNVNTIILR